MTDAFENAPHKSAQSNNGISVQCNDGSMRNQETQRYATIDD